ncbi:UPAR/Ly6 domain-containing protein cold [Hetaerina americana]|uniref:UPAR/Ly6 domain-containing protein cold n=1 Tax=Hetaerina americana TaxID=62018 RepID=UPI003A7F53D2
MQTPAMFIIPAFLLFLSFSPSCYAFECYVCANQSDNSEKCLKTIKTCEHDQDMCLTEVRWGTEPYWSQGADKQYYISKTCANNETCERVIRKTLPYCTHIWYEDWKCAECCRGDRCNYYVILGASYLSSSWTALVLGCVAATTVWRLHLI